MTNDTKIKTPKVGDVLHWLVDGVTFQLDSGWVSGVVSKRGQEVTIENEELLSANTGRTGVCLFDLLHDSAGQEARFGRQIMAPGPCPEGMLVTTPGTYEHQLARRKLIEEARDLPEDERKAAVESINARYGSAPTSSQTLADYDR